MSEDLSADESDLLGEFSQFFEDETADGPDDTSEAPAAPVAAAETPSDAPAPRDDGRDAQGRFTAKARAAADSLDAPAANAAESAQPTTPGEIQPPAADAAPATDTPPAPADEPFPMEPFVVRVGDRQHPIEGAVVTPHGLVVPPERVQDLHTLIGRGLKYDDERALIKRERATLHQERATHQAEVAPVLREIDQFFGMARALKDAGTPEAQEAAAAQLIEYALQFASNEPLLKERMQFERERAEFELARQAQQPDPEESAAQLQQQTDATIVATVREWAQTEWGQHLTAQDWDALRQRVHSNPAMYLRRAGERVTAEEQAAGITPGEVYFNTPALEQDAQFVATIRREAVQREAQHKQALDAARKAAEENAKRLAAPKVPTPAAPKPKATPKPPQADEIEDSDAEARRLRREFEEMLG